jgi:hypothetical protein
LVYVRWPSFKKKIILDKFEETKVKVGKFAAFWAATKAATFVA